MNKKWNKIAFGIIFVAILAVSFYKKTHENTVDASNESVLQSAVEASADSALPIVIEEAQIEEPKIESPKSAISKNGSYDSKEAVSLYIHTYNKLPKNYITKKEAQALGWPGGSLEPYAPGKSIGGDKFGNREGILPKKSGRNYTECDIDTKGKSSRGAKRIVFSNDGLIFYTKDHYESFERLYGEQ